MTMAMQPAEQRPRGSLRVLLGAAPGVGKTYAMLAEGLRRQERGADVVIGLVETHGRPQTQAMTDGLELVPRREVQHKGSTLTDLDLDAVLARRPGVVLVDELAHTNAPGGRHKRRVEDVEDLLAAGIDVITTVNVQHLESLNDVVANITGVRQRETIPDAVVRAADQIELVDMTPEALRRRMAHGNIYRPERIDDALGNFFRPGNLAALRELALLWLADRVEQGLTDYRRTHDISNTWQTRDRVVVALSGGPEGGTLIRRGARIAHRGAGGELVAAYVVADDGLARSDNAELARQRGLVEDLSGTFHTLTGDDPAQTLVEFARQVNATHLVVGATRTGRWSRLWRDPVDRRIVELATDLDVHLVSHEWSGQARRPRPPLPSWRRGAAIVVAVLGAPLLTAALVQLRPHDNQTFALMAFLTLTVVVALIGGMVPALVAAIAGALLVNWFFSPPLHTLTISDPQTIVVLIVFVLVGCAVAWVVDRAASRARLATRVAKESQQLYLLTDHTLSTGFDATELLAWVAQLMGQRTVQLRHRDSLTSGWQVSASSRREPESDTPDTRIALGEGADTTLDELALFGPALGGGEDRVLEAFGRQYVARLERDRLRTRAAKVRELEARDNIQSALLAALSHDLRTPLAAIKASSSSLLAPDVQWSADDRADLIAMIDANADRLARLINNLLDLTRLRTGAMPIVESSAPVAELLAAARAGAMEPSRIRVGESAHLGSVVTDQGLVERILGNVLDNAVRHEPDGSQVELTAERLDNDDLEIRVIDHGPGVPQERRQAMFEPFQRVGDVPSGQGIGLGLAVARGFADALSAGLVAEHTAGGGLTMVVRLIGSTPDRKESSDE